jgi:hypothetical protein
MRKERLYIIESFGTFAGKGEVPKRIFEAKRSQFFTEGELETKSYL